MTRKQIALSCFIVAIAALLCAVAMDWRALLHGNAEGPEGDEAGNLPVKKFSEGPPITEFQLTERSGEEFQSQSLDDQIWVASFFFTKCGGNCRMLNMRVAQLQREFGPRGVRFVSISCDPEEDTPEKMSQYAEMFQADRDQWLFLTGDFKYIQRVGWDMFRVALAPMGHADQLVVIDAAGERRGSFLALHDEQFDRMKQLLNELLEHRQQTNGDQSDEASAQQASAGEPFVARR